MEAMNANVVADIEQITMTEGNSVTILSDNPDPNLREVQAAVDVCGDFTSWKEMRYWGETWMDALHKAADASRLFNSTCLIKDKRR